MLIERIFPDDLSFSPTRSEKVDAEEDNYWKTLLRSALATSIAAKEMSFKEQGLVGSSLMGIILYLELDLLEMTEACPGIVNHLLHSPQDEIIDSIKRTIDELQINNECPVTILKSKLHFNRLPFLQSMLIEDQAELFAASELRQTLKGVQRGFGSLRILSICITDADRIQTIVQPLAKYFRCINIRCRARELVQHLWDFEPTEYPFKCSQCQEKLTDLSLLSTEDCYFETRAGLLQGGGIRELIVRSDKKLDRGKFWVWGWPALELNKCQYYFQLAGWQKIDEQPRDALLVHCYSPRILWGEKLSPTRLLQFLWLLTSARILIISKGDAWHWRIANLLAQGAAQWADSIDAKLFKKYSQHPETLLPRIFLIRPKLLPKLAKLTRHYEIVLNWTRYDFLATEEPNVIELWRIAASLDMVITWDPVARQRIQRCFAQFHSNAATLSRTADFRQGMALPLHEPAKQMSLLLAMAENGARLRGSNIVSLADVILIEQLSEQLLVHRFGNHDTSDREKKR